MNTYSHVMPEMSGAASRAMDAALEERPADGPDLVPLEGLGLGEASTDDEALEG